MLLESPSCQFSCFWFSPQKPRQHNGCVGVCLQMSRWQTILAEAAVSSGYFKDQTGRRSLIFRLDSAGLMSGVLINVTWQSHVWYFYELAFSLYTCSPDRCHLLCVSVCECILYILSKLYYKINDFCIDLNSVSTQTKQACQRNNEGKLLKALFEVLYTFRMMQHLWRSRRLKKHEQVTNLKNTGGCELHTKSFPQKK